MKIMEKLLKAKSIHKTRPALPEPKLLPIKLSPAETDAYRSLLLAAISLVSWANSIAEFYC